MSVKTLFVIVLATGFLTLLFCEFLIYFIVIGQCNWPKIESSDLEEQAKTVRAMLLADTHLLGPFRGHWFDKLRREWQMHRAFQTAVHIFYPDVVFFLGDQFDEGEWVDDRGFREYVLRFRKLFHVPDDIKLIGMAGNHDVGFHYRLYPDILFRFNEAFNSSAINLHTIRNVNFVTINSMAMENDGCYFCEDARLELKRLHDILECSRNKNACKDRKILSKLTHYSQPIVMEHFPTYRKSDKSCSEGDAPDEEFYRENWEVLSKESTDLLGKLLNPRVIFSGHSHHYCKVKNRLRIEEYTLASFSWRNKNNPSFILAHFTPERHFVSVCYLPEENTVILIYMCSACLSFIILLFYLAQKNKTKAD